MESAGPGTWVGIPCFGRLFSWRWSPLCAPPTASALPEHSWRGLVKKKNVFDIFFRESIFIYIYVYLSQFRMEFKILWVTTHTQLFLTPKKKFPLAGEWPKLFREKNVEKTRLCGVKP